MAQGFSYSFRKTQGLFLTVGMKIPMTGRASEGIVATFTNEITRTYTEVDGHGVHVATDDEGSGTVVVNLQGTSLADTLIRQLADLQTTTGSDMHGTFTLSDLAGTATLVTLSNALLSSNPGMTMAAGQPMVAWTFSGHLSIRKFGAVPVPFGPTPPIVTL